MNHVDTLTQLFERFPGIGPRQAKRFVQYVLNQPQSVRLQLAQAIQELGAYTKQCELCFRWFVREGRTGTVCDMCASTTREADILCVIEKDADIGSIENGGFKGKYFVLGGVIPFASETPQKYIRLKELTKRITKEGSVLKELILGLSATRESDHTRLILTEELRPLSETFGFTISSFGRGLSTGSELEYADPDTVAHALHSRQ